MSNTKAILSAIRGGLSPARIGTYEVAVRITGDSDPRAAALYAWNAQASAALLIALHFCEVVVRNGAADALEAVYGARWPWNPVFILSLPNPPQRSIYNPRSNLKKVASQQPSTGKVIPELNFVFLAAAVHASTRRATVELASEACFPRARSQKDHDCNPQVYLRGLGGDSAATKPNRSSRTDLHKESQRGS